MSSPSRPYRGVSADERAAARRTALVEAALDLLGAADPRPVTMTAICERAGLTERYFYESFRSRDELLLALLDGIAGEILDAVVGALDRTPGTPRERARASIAAFVQILTDDPRKGRVAIIEAVGIASLRRRRRELLSGFEALVVERAHELYGDHALSAPDDQMASLFFVGGLAELVSGWLTGEFEATPDQIVEAALRHFDAAAHP